MRGEHARRVCVRHLVSGIIPACAGSTRCNNPRPSTLRDHPRMRGEHMCEYTIVIQAAGSSPHARGALVHVLVKGLADGIIPACAGSTRLWESSHDLHRDHPRMRGEHFDRAAIAHKDIGSSPHARGALRARRRRPFEMGIIPACAGSTVALSGQKMPSQDHPRMRGEHRAPVSMSRAPSGSSPHARGALPNARLSVIRRGIIPACAGSTTRTRSCARCAGDHPRMRGEHASASWSVVVLLGSSPHARGARRALRDGGRGAGIIPACAGSTLFVSPPVSVNRDHPRMRGEHKT